MIALVAALVVPGAALAQPSAADRDAARRLMSEAREKRDANDLLAALKLFSAADGIMHVPTTGIEVAQTEAALGHLVDARDTALRVGRTTAEPHEPAQFEQARERARTLGAELAKRISTLRFVLRRLPPGVEPNVTVDGQTVPPAAVLVPRPVDPGHHRVSATAGELGGSVDVDLGEGEVKDATVELLPLTPPAPPPPPPPKKAGGGIGKPLLFAGIGLAGAGLVVGTVAGLVSTSKTSSLKDICRADRCPSSASSDIDSARSAATVSNVGFIAGAAGAAIGVLGFVLWKREAPSAAESRTEALRVRPWIGAASAGVSGSF